MKALFAALLLLFQLQPIVGTAACLGLSGRGSQQDCEMPEHGAVPYRTLAQTDSPAQSCELATLCAPTPLAIPSLGGGLESVLSLHAEAGTTASTIPPGTSSTPPFHPPRA